MEKVQHVANATLADIDPVVDRIVEQLQNVFESYGAVPADALRPTVERAAESALETLARGQLPSEQEIAEVVGGVETQARYGVSIEDVLWAFRLGTRELWSMLRSRAASHGLEAVDELAAAEALWAWDDLIRTQAIVVHRIVELEVARRSGQEHLDFLKAAMSDLTDETELTARAEELDLPIAEALIPFRARPHDDASHDDLEREITESIESGTAIAAVLAGDVVGLSSGSPRISSATDACLGLGPKANLGNLEASFGLAARTLETAAALGLSGTFHFEELAIQSVLVADDDVGDLLVSKYVHPLERGGRKGEQVLDTLAEYFRLDRNIEAVAETLELHPNTVRYRLRRFEEVSGAELSNTEDLVRAWWALGRRELATGTRQAEDGDDGTSTGASPPPRGAVSD